MKYRAWVVHETPNKTFEPRLETLDGDRLPDHDTRVRVQWSSLNYKDALSFSGHKGITRSYPHTPGIDAAGVVESSPVFAPGTRVLVVGYDLGMNTSGGLAEFIQVPSEWVIPFPEGWSMREAMTFGTAGFTAGQCLERLLENRVTPEKGPIVVTGATGGVGSVAVALLAARGFEVVAASRDPEKARWLRELGAADIVDANELVDDSGKPMLKGRWAGAVETVGGPVLESLTRSMMHRGVLTCCGMIAGTRLHTNVFPFILRGLTLVGIDSAECPRDLKERLWHRLAGEWAPPTLDPLRREISLEDVPDAIRDMLDGNSRGRVVVRVEG